MSFLLSLCKGPFKSPSSPLNCPTMPSLCPKEFSGFSFFPRWLLYPKPFFEDTPYILEPGEYPTLEAWGTSGPSVGSLKPMRLVRSMGYPQAPLPLVSCGVALHLWAGEGGYHRWVSW